jgi:hypothetical protein
MNGVVHDSVHRLLGLMGVGPSCLEVCDEVVKIEEVCRRDQVIVVTQEFVSPWGRLPFTELESPSHLCFGVREWSDLNVIPALLNEVTGGGGRLAHKLTGEFGLGGSCDRGWRWWRRGLQCRHLLGSSHVGHTVDGEEQVKMFA